MNCNKLSHGPSSKNAASIRSRKICLYITCLNVCKTGGSGSEELRKCPSSSSAVLGFVNVRGRKPRQKKKTRERFLKVKKTLKGPSHPNVVHFNNVCHQALVIMLQYV